MYGGTEGEGKPLYCMAPKEPEPAENENKPHESGLVVTFLVNSGAFGHYVDDIIIPDLKHRLLDYTFLSTPRTILTAGGALLDGTAKGVLQGLITEDYGEQHLALVVTKKVPGIGRNRFSVKAAAKTARKGNNFDVNKPRLVAGDVNVPLRGKDDDRQSFKLDLGADGYAEKELAMNAVANAQV